MMNMFKYSIGVLFISVCFTVSVSAHTATISEHPLNDKINKHHKVLSKTHLGSYFYVGTEAEIIISQSNNQPPLLDNTTSNAISIRLRSSQLSLNERHTYTNYDGLFYRYSFLRAIIFPFHSFL